MIKLYKFLKVRKNCCQVCIRVGATYEIRTGIAPFQDDVSLFNIQCKNREYSVVFYLVISIGMRRKVWKVNPLTALIGMRIVYFRQTLGIVVRSENFYV